MDICIYIDRYFLLSNLFFISTDSEEDDKPVAKIREHFIDLDEQRCENVNAAKVL